MTITNLLERPAGKLIVQWPRTPTFALSMAATRRRQLE